MGEITPEGMPFALRWLSPPARWSQANAVLTIHAGPGTDWFVDPSGTSAPIVNAPALVGRLDCDFVFSARVEVDFAATFDAGVLLVHAHERAWAKLCFERSPGGEPMIVSVVTRRVSDDCNSVVVEGNSVWLRISRLGTALAFHASTDGSYWQLVRHFALNAAKAPAVGFLAQSPLGNGCRASFDHISFESRRLSDLRNGD
jgi:uncharacterized protein